MSLKLIPFNKTYFVIPQISKLSSNNLCSNMLSLRCPPQIINPTLEFINLSGNYSSRNVIVSLLVIIFHSSYNFSFVKIMIVVGLDDFAGMWVKRSKTQISSGMEDPKENWDNIQVQEACWLCKVIIFMLLLCIAVALICLEETLSVKFSDCLCWRRKILLIESRLCLFWLKTKFINNHFPRKPNFNGKTYWWYLFV